VLELEEVVRVRARTAHSLQSARHES
jgi:hypothetical protein